MSIKPEDREDAMRLLVNAAMIAQRHGLEIAEEAESSRQAIVAMAIMFSSAGAAAGCSLHDLMGLLMEVHKKTLEMEDDE
jgi:hypothetical protein